MISIEQSPYRFQILHKLEMPFGTIYLLEDAVVSELHEGVVGTTAHAKIVLEKSLEYYSVHNVVKKRVWIANRTQKYAVQPVGWIQMKNLAKEYLYGYCVVDDTKYGMMSAILKSNFVPINFKSVRNLEAAMDWVKFFKIE